MTPRVRAADPTMLFRSGGRTIADIAARYPVPFWVPPQDEVSYRLTCFFHGEHEAAREMRAIIADRCAVFVSIPAGTLPTRPAYAGG